MNVAVKDLLSHDFNIVILIEVPSHMLGDEGLWKNRHHPLVTPCNPCVTQINAKSSLRKKPLIKLRRGQIKKTGKQEIKHLEGGLV
jgi:hypothetical protein